MDLTDAYTCPGCLGIRPHCICKINFWGEKQGGSEVNRKVTIDYEKLVKSIPVNKRQDLLALFVTGLNLDIVYSILDRKIEYITRNGHRIIIGEKPVQRKVHYLNPVTQQIMCPTGFNMPAYSIKTLKKSMNIPEVTCLRCLAMMKALDNKREAEKDVMSIELPEVLVSNKLVSCRDFNLAIQTSSSERQQLVQSAVHSLDKGERVLIITSRVDFMHHINQMISEHNSEYLGDLFFSGSTTKERRRMLASSNLVIAVLQTISTGVNLSGFDRLIFIDCRNNLVVERIVANYEGRKITKKVEQKDGVVIEVPRAFISELQRDGKARAYKSERYTK
jgi:hypothetical protein